MIRCHSRPRFRRHVRVDIVDGDGVFLCSEHHSQVIQGEHITHLAPLLTGEHTMTEIADALTGRHNALDLYHAVNQLEANGHVVADELGEDAARGWFDAAAADGERAHLRVSEMAIGVVHIGETCPDPVARAIRALGASVDTARDPAPDRLTVVVTDDYLRPELAEIDDAHRQVHGRWLLAKPVGTVVWLGPRFDSGPGCWTCLAHRYRTNRRVARFIADRRGIDSLGTLPAIGLPATIELAAQLIATEVAAIGADIGRIRGVTCFDTVAMASEFHELTPRPQCPVCGQPDVDAVRQRRRVTFTSRRKTFTADGGHRALDPETFLARYERHVSPITGVVTELTPVRPDLPFIRTVHAGHNLARPLSLDGLRKGLRSQSCGKGTTSMQARASALGEGIERCSGVFQGDEERRRAAFVALGDDAINPNSCLHFSDRQYESRDATNRHASTFQFVPERLDPDVLIDWSPVWSATHARVRWLPTSYLYYGFPARDGAAVAWADSNGCASGTSLEDAVLQGIYELVERDSVAMWWYNRISRPGVDLDSFHEPWIDRLRDEYATLRRDLWVLDLTADLNVPTFAAVSRRTDKAAQDILVAFGAHGDARIAVLRALTEMNQFLTAIADVTEDGTGYRVEDRDQLRWFTTATAADEPYLLPDPMAPPVRCGDHAVRVHDDLLADLEDLQRALGDRGLELLVLDQTRPDIGVPVARVIVPGLRHFWRRLGPGRLYDAPVECGWLSQPLTEDDVNPWSVFV